MDGLKWEGERGKREERITPTNPPTRSEMGIIQLAFLETKENAPYFSRSVMGGWDTEDLAARQLAEHNVVRDEGTCAVLGLTLGQSMISPAQKPERGEEDKQHGGSFPL
jgi:hypothetical protein